MTGTKEQPFDLFRLGLVIERCRHARSSPNSAIHDHAGFVAGGKRNPEYRSTGAADLVHIAKHRRAAVVTDYRPVQPASTRSQSRSGALNRLQRPRQAPPTSLCAVPIPI